MRCRARAGEAEAGRGSGPGPGRAGRRVREERGSAPGPISRPAGQVEEGKGEKGQAKSRAGLRMKEGREFSK